MGKVSNRRNSIFPLKKKRSKTNKPAQKENNSPSTQQQPQQQPQQVRGPSLMDSVKSGFGFGVGNAAVHGMIDVFNEVSSENTNSVKRDIHNQTTALCENTLKNYNECLELHSDKFHPVCIEIKNFMENLNCHEMK